jgi:hypothetical protein
VGIKQPKGDQVIALVGRAQKRTRVVDHGSHPRIAVRMFRMPVAPQHKNGRIDFDRVDMLGVAPQRSRDVVPRTRAHNRNILRMLDELIRKLVVVLDPPQRGPIRTVGKIVNPLVVVTRRPDFHQASPVAPDFQQLVGGIDPLEGRSGRPFQDHQGQHRKARPNQQSRLPASVEEQQAGESEQEPYGRRGPERAHHKHQQHSDETSQQIKAIPG